MYNINVGLIELIMFGALILGNYIKNKIDTRTRNKNVNDVFQGSIHLGIALYTIYNIQNNNTFNANLLQETNKMFSHYTKNINEMVASVKVKIDEINEKNEQMIEVYKNILEKTSSENVEKNSSNDENMVQQTLTHPQFFGNN
jgi:hypothetical protein